EAGPVIGPVVGKGLLGRRRPGRDRPQPQPGGQRETEKPLHVALPVGPSQVSGGGRRPGPWAAPATSRLTARRRRSSRPFSPSPPDGGEGGLPEQIRQNPSPLPVPVLLLLRPPLRIELTVVLPKSVTPRTRSTGDSRLDRKLSARIHGSALT